MVFVMYILYSSTSYLPVTAFVNVSVTVALLLLLFTFYVLRPMSYMLREKLSLKE